MKINRDSFEESVEFDLYSCDFGSSILEKYCIVDRIYDKEHTVLYKMIHIDSEMYFTLKVIHKNIMPVHDLKDILSLDHEHIAKVIEYGESERFVYVIKPFYRGISLYEFISRRGPVSERRVLDMAKQISSVLKYLHSQKNPLVYRDLKPANIIMLPSGKLVLIDVESIRSLKEGQQTEPFPVATHGYASPEQYGFMPSTTRSDIYGLGATLYFLLTGHEPINRQFSYAHFTEVNDTISRKMIDVIKTCMKFNPDERFEDVKSFETALFSKVSPWVRKQSKKVTAVAVVLILALSVGLYNLSLSDTFITRKAAIEKGYDSPDEVKLFNITVISDHLSYKSTDEETVKRIIVDRDALSSNSSEFVYISLFHIDETFEVRTVEETIFGVSQLGFGLNLYIDEIGHKFNVRKFNTRYLVLLFDEDIKCVGYGFITI